MDARLFIAIYLAIALEWTGFKFNFLFYIIKYHEYLISEREQASERER